MPTIADPLPLRCGVTRRRPPGAEHGGAGMDGTRPLDARFASILVTGLLTVLAAGCDDPTDRSTEPWNAAQASLAHAGRWQIPADVLAAGATSRVTLTEAGAWRGEASCSGTFTEGAQRVRTWVTAHWPQVTNVGGYSCRPINGNAAVTSIHAVGRALDLHIPVAAGSEADNDLGDELANYLVANAQYIGVQRVIWDRTYWRGGDAPREGYYDGAHPHNDHIHVELSVAASHLETPFFVDGQPPPQRGPCGPPLGEEGGRIDDADDCFALYGPSQYWRRVDGEGVGAGLWWTNAYQGDNPSNWARWAFRVAATGRYTVEVHTVAAWSAYSAVRYQVDHAGGAQELTVDLAGRDGWSSLGDYRFVADDREFAVSMFDHSAEPVGSDLHITADAVRLTRADRPEPPAPDAATPDPPPPDAAPARDAAVPPDLGPGPDPTDPDAGGGEPSEDAGALDEPQPDDDPPAGGGEAGGDLTDGGLSSETRATGSRGQGGCTATPGGGPGDGGPWALLITLTLGWRRRSSRGHHGGMGRDSPG